jgi:glutamate N-acetyltransferase/amino-acid N-acetyltransferase
MKTLPLPDGSITTPAGFVAGTSASGMKKDGGRDVAILFSEHDCSAAAVFTRNVVVAAPVILDRATLAANPDRIRGVVANAKNANACTGEPGLEAARLMQAQAAALTGCTPEQFFVLSTGVIGVQPPLDKIGPGIEEAAANLGPHGREAAEAIMTTDTRPKHLAVRVEWEEAGQTHALTVGGIAKGSGMIHPDMATMLAVLTTDAAVRSGLLQAVLHHVVNQTFNRISVDGDSSTNDTVLLLANGAAGVVVDSAETLAGQALITALHDVALHLAQAIVRDGEGASRFIELSVSGTADDAAAHRVANTIATSPLVKTAFAGGDANWGRILAAAGRAGVPFDQGDAALWIGRNRLEQLQLLAGGTPTGYAEADAAAIFAHRDIHVWLELGNGPGQATVWSCDLTHDYVSINADYRT